MRKKLLWLTAIVFVIWLAYSLTVSFFGVRESSFSWTIIAKNLVPLVLLTSLFAYLLSRGRESVSNIKNRLVSLYILGASFLFWIVSPIEDFFILNISGKELATNSIFYLIEGTSISAIGIAVFLLWYKPVGDFLNKYQSNIKSITKEEVIKVSNIVSKFPVKTAVTALCLSAAGYVLSAISFLIIHPDFSLGLSLNIVLIGLAMGQAIFAIIYFFSRRILADITHILYSFGDITSPNKTLGIKFKIMISAACPGVFFVSTYLALLLSFLANRINFSLFSMGIVLNSILSFVIMYIISSGLITGLLNALKEIKRGIEIVQSGSLQNRINVKTGDEIESVAYEFNKMTDYLEKRCK